MSKCRSKLFVGFWFILISLGQAYPYAVAYAHTQEDQCGCNLKGHKCIHGCDLKKKSSATPCHQGGQQEGHHGAMDPKEAKGHRVAEETSKQDQWISPNCSRRTVQKILSFQTEPFLPSPVRYLQGPPAVEFFLNPAMAPAGPLLSCDEPPPKGDEPPKDPA